MAIRERKKILGEMDELLIKEEIMWKQRSCFNKIIFGDRNTNFFETKASWRAKKYNITVLKRSDGSLTENMEEIKGITNSFFQHLYTCNSNVDPSLIT